MSHPSRPDDGFSIQPIKRFTGTSLAIKRPREIACFSYDDNREFHLDESSLRYYYPPRLDPESSRWFPDLSSGFESFRPLNETKDEHLDALLKTIVDLEQRTGERCRADFVTWRGMMTKIMTAPYEKFDGFAMKATRYQDTIYVEEDHNFKLSEKESQGNTWHAPLSQQQMTYWGYKFESLCLIPDTWDAVPRGYIESRDAQPVSNSAQYCSIVRTGIGPSNLVLGGEVDAVWDRKPEDKDEPINWVELKTMQVVGTTNSETLKFERKLCRIWAQSFLLGVPKAVIGFRSPNGILTRIEEMEVLSIPGIVRKSTHAWDANVCIRFAGEFLDYLQNKIQSEGVYRIMRRKGSPVIEVAKLEETGTGDIISQEFLDWREKHLEQDNAKALG